MLVCFKTWESDKQLDRWPQYSTEAPPQLADSSTDGRTDEEPGMHYLCTALNSLYGSFKPTHSLKAIDTSTTLRSSARSQISLYLDATRSCMLSYTFKLGKTASGAIMVIVDYTDPSQRVARCTDEPLGTGWTPTSFTHCICEVTLRRWRHYVSAENWSSKAYPSRPLLASDWHSGSCTQVKYFSHACRWSKFAIYIIAYTLSWLCTQVGTETRGKCLQKCEKGLYSLALSKAETDEIVERCSTLNQPAASMSRALVNSLCTWFGHHMRVLPLLRLLISYTGWKGAATHRDHRFPYMKQGI